LNSEVVVAPRVAADSPLAAGVRALRRFWRPFVLIQVAAVALATAYHFVGAVRDACAALARWKVAGGLPFAAAASAVAGGLLPELAKRLTGVGLQGDGAAAGAPVRRDAIPFRVGFFAAAGIVVDLLYRSEARLFGDGGDLATVAAKTAFDQFVFTPLWSVVILAVFLWHQRGYAAAAMWSDLRRGFLRRRLLPLLLPNWFFWIPMLSIIYAFPLPLQFVLFVLVLAAWSLIMVFIAGE
jgi:hypothetical protein